MTDYRLVVIGAGLIGAAAARHGASATRGVAVVGPAEPHDYAAHDGPFASHYDSGRITRHLDESPVWSELAARSIRHYAAIESASGISFHRPVGLLWSDRVAGRLENLSGSSRRHGIALRPISAADAAAAWGWSFPSDRSLGFEAGPAGYIDPRRMVRAQLTAMEKAGGERIDGVVTGIIAGPTSVRIQLGSGLHITADRVIVAAGAYSSFLLRGHAEVPIVPIATAVIMAEVTTATADALAGMPAMIHRIGDESTVDVYAVPPTRYPDGRWYLKLGAEVVPEQELTSEGAMRRWMTGGAPGWRAHLESCFRDVLPDVDVIATTLKPCMYARTPHRHPFVAFATDRIVVAAGGNGRAAKSADAIGSLASELALAGSWNDDLDPAHFALVR